METVIKPECFKISKRNVKTNIFVMAFIKTVTRDNAIKFAVISEILKNFSKKYKTPVEMSRRLNEMLGAVYDVQCIKKGDNLVLCLTLECIKSVSDKEAEGFLEDIVLKPMADEGGFEKEVFKKACDAVRERIRARKDDKKAYAEEKCVEIMFGKEGYGVPIDGYEEDLTFDRKELFEYYKGFFCERIIKGVMGTVTEAYVMPKENSDITEEDNSAQGRLCLSFTTKGEYMPLLVLNEIIGGNAGSKLFSSVREKESLCYYVNSSLNRFKKIIVVRAGIEKEAKEKTVRIIKETIDGLKDSITDEDMKTAKAAVKNIFMMKEDNLYGEVDNVIDGAILGFEPIKERMDRAEAVSKADVLEACNGIRLNTVYFLA